MGSQQTSSFASLAEWYWLLGGTAHGPDVVAGFKNLRSER